MLAEAVVWLSTSSLLEKDQCCYAQAFVHGNDFLTEYYCLVFQFKYIKHSQIKIYLMEKQMTEDNKYCFYEKIIKIKWNFP